MNLFVCVCFFLFVVENHFLTNAYSSLTRLQVHKQHLQVVLYPEIVILGKFIFRTLFY